MTDRAGRVCSSHGMEILWETVPHARTVSLGFFFPSGSQDDPPGKNGTAHFVEHMLFKGSVNYSASALALAIDRLGGEINAYTDREEMAFHCTVPAEHWKKAAEVLFEVCFRPLFPENEVEKEREVIRSEILSASEDPEDQSFETFMALAHPGTPYGNPVAGTFDSLDAITLDDLWAWYRSLVNHDFFLAMAGPLEVAEVLAWVEGQPFPVKTAPVREERPIPGPHSFTQAVKARFQTAQVVGSFTFPPGATLEQSLYVQWFSLLWGENMSSRLFQHIREEKGLCYGISSQASEETRRPVVHFFASCAPDRADEVLIALKEEVSALEFSPNDDEWEAARQALVGALILSSERMENRMQRLAQGYRTLDLVVSLGDLLALAESLDAQPAWAYLAPSLKNVSLLLWGTWKKLKVSRWEGL